MKNEMKNKIKNSIIAMTLSIVGLLAATNTIAQIDSSFSYQGELYESGAPANDTYDISINAFDSMGNPFGFGHNAMNVPVVNGLFNLDVFLGIGPFSGNSEIFLEVSVRKSSIGGAYTTLSPLQAINAVPLASNLISGGALNDQILTFNGIKWIPADSIWAKNGLRTEHLEDVAIGTTATAATHRLTVKSTDDKTLRLIGNTGTFGYDGKLNFGDGDLVYLHEDSDDHLEIHADLGVNIFADVTQPIDAGGVMKFMVHANCSLASPSIFKQYNGVNTGAATIVSSALNGLCKITFPFDISNRFYQVSVVDDLSGKSANCQISGSGLDLNCARFSTSSGAGNNGQIMILVY